MQRNKTPPGESPAGFFSFCKTSLNSKLAFPARLFFPRARSLHDPSQTPSLFRPAAHLRFRDCSWQLRCQRRRSSGVEMCLRRQVRGAVGLRRFPGRGIPALIHPVLGVPRPVPRSRSGLLLLETSAFRRRAAAGRVTWKLFRPPVERSFLFDANASPNLGPSFFSKTWTNFRPIADWWLKCDG